MKTIKTFAQTAALLIVQCVFSHILRVNGIFAELLFVYALAAAYFEKKSRYYSLAVGAVCGVLAGCVCGSPTFYAIAYVAAVWAVSEFSGLLFSKIFLPFVPAVMIMTFFENSLFFAVPAIDAEYSSAFFNTVLPAMLYNAAAAVPVGLLVKKSVCGQRN